MTTQNGSLFILQVGNGATPENFTTIGGLKTTGFKLNNKFLASDNLESGQWQRAIQGGISSIIIDASGIFTNSAAEETVRTNAFNGSINDYQLTFGNGDTLEGAFSINSLDKSGEYDEAEIYSLTLQSAGPITYTKG